MELSYDPRYNIAYIKLQEKPGEVEIVRVSESLLIDLAADGTVYGIELLNANEQLFKKDAGHFIVTNEATGKATEISLP